MVCVSQNTKHNYTNHSSLSTSIHPLLTAPQGHWRCWSQALGRDTPGHQHSHHSHWHLEHFSVSTQPWSLLLWGSRAHRYCHSSFTDAKCNQRRSWETEPKLLKYYAYLANFSRRRCCTLTFDSSVMKSICRGLKSSHKACGLLMPEYNFPYFHTMWE